MNPLLSKPVLDRMRRTLYGSVSWALVLYKLTPSEGEVEAVRCVSGFFPMRAKKDNDSSKHGDVRLYLAADAGFTASQLHSGAVIGLEKDGKVVRYVIKDLLGFQQIGTGWNILLTPEQAATA